MSANFSRTLRSLDADRSRRRTLGLLFAAALVAGWIAWFVLGRVSVYELSDRARVEVHRAAHPVAAPVAGRVVTTRLRLGKTVREGQVVVELDSERQRLALEEAKVRLEGVRQRLAAVQAEVQAEKEGLRAHEEASRVAVEESRARVVEARAKARRARERLETLATLHGEGIESSERLKEAEAEAEAEDAALDALRLGTDRLERERRVAGTDRRARLAKLERQAVELERQAENEKAAIRRLEREIELRRIRAPIDGRVGKAAEVSVGSVVRTADVLGSIVPPGTPRAVAYFPVASVGRLRPGQPARLRLDGFPWTQYGTPRATVRHVANEPVEGRVRVELALNERSAPAIPMEHGLSGTAEVETERVSPAALVLRAAGKRLSERSSWTARTDPGALAKR